MRKMKEVPSDRSASHKLMRHQLSWLGEHGTKSMDADRAMHTFVTRLVGGTSDTYRQMTGGKSCKQSPV